MSVQMWFIGLFLMFQAVALSQESAGQNPVDKKVSVDTGIRYLTGNTNLEGMSFGFDWMRRSDFLENTLDVNWDYLHQDDEVIREFASVASSVDIYPRGKWSPFGFLGWQHDEKKLIDHRSQGGVGVRYVLAQSEKSKHSLSLAYLFEREQSTLEGLKTEELRYLSWRLKHDFPIGDHTQIKMVAFWQFSDASMSDQRITAALTMKNQIRGGFSTKLGVDYDYDREPVAESVTKDQTVMQFSLNYTWKVP